MAGVLGHISDGPGSDRGGRVIGLQLDRKLSCEFEAGVQMPARIGGQYMHSDGRILRELTQKEFLRVP